MLRNRLLLQLLFNIFAAVSIVSLSVVLITEAVRNAESVVVSESQKTLAAATQELAQQYEYRVSFDSDWSKLPKRAQDISLMGISQTVLASFPGVEGGFFAQNGLLGYAFPTHDTGTAKTDVPSAEADLILSAARGSVETQRMRQELQRGRSDLLILAARPLKRGNASAWAMQRMERRNQASERRRNLLLGTLVLAALLSIGGTLATGISLARGITQVKSGLQQLEHEFDFRLPERADELGSISKAINRMAMTRRKLEVELRREDRLRALGRLSAGLAHEIRNPLNNIRLTIELLERRAGTKSIGREDLQTVRTEIDRLSQLLKELLDLQQTRKASPEIQRVEPVVRHCIELVRNQATTQDVSIVMNGDGTKEARFDAAHLTQALVNLLLNALEASSAGSVIEVQIEEFGDGIQVRVKDEGIGLNEEQQEHIFEPFYTTKTNGTGLGLAVSRELMRSQGGELRFVPQITGACFVIELPYAQDSATKV